MHSVLNILQMYNLITQTRVCIRFSFLQIEQVAKLAIPLAFLAFNLAYWPIVLVKYVDGR